MTIHRFSVSGRVFRWEELAPGIPWTRHDEDGHAHLAYYDKPHTLAFIWDGNVGNSIQVCPDGSGEPIRYLIHTEGLIPEVPAMQAAFLEHFAITCQLWIRNVNSEAIQNRSRRRKV